MKGAECSILNIQVFMMLHTDLVDLLVHIHSTERFKK